jgi:ribosome-binding ATPase YchF (GTP1/OBG family)
VPLGHSDWYWPCSDPEEARIPVPDERFDWLSSVYKPKTEIPAFLTCIDIAGLTAGASTGAGLGNAFLSHVRAVDGIFQVVRAFDDAEVIHVEGDVDPLRDMQIISTELRLKDIEWVDKALEMLKKTNRNLGSSSLADKAKKEEIVGGFSLAGADGRRPSRRLDISWSRRTWMSGRAPGPTRRLVPSCLCAHFHLITPLSDEKAH